MCPDFFQSYDNGVGECHTKGRHSYLNACMGLSLAALNAGNMPARTPTSALNPNATAMADPVIIGAFSVGEKDSSMWTNPTEVARPAKPPRIAMTIDSTRI